MFLSFRLSPFKPLTTNLLIDNKENEEFHQNNSYENLQMDYIAQLRSEGYKQEAVIRALGIAKNDLQMARDILHEFASKNYHRLNQNEEQQLQ